MVKKKVQSSVLPPQSIEAEQSLLGGLLVSHNRWDDIADLVHEADFYRPEHRQIFSAIQHLCERDNAVDVVTVSEKLARDKLLDGLGGTPYLIELVKMTPAVANLAAYAQIVRQYSIRRQLHQTSQEIAESALHNNSDDVSQLLDIAEQKILNIGEQQHKGGGLLSISSFLPAAVQRIDHLFHVGSQITGLPTGYRDLDKMTAGLQKGDLFILAGRPSMGKTTLAMNIAESVVLSGNKTVAIFSLEMPATSLVDRVLASLGEIRLQDLRTGRLNKEDWPRLVSAVALLEERGQNLFIEDWPGMSPMDIRTRCRRLKREQKGALDLVVIDYLQLMGMPGFRENRTSEISEISRSLKLLAKELEVPIIALSQLNRGLELRPNQNKRPIMSDLRDSGSIEQDADIIGFVYRDEVYNKDTTDKGVAEIIVAKQRNGPTGTIKLVFQGEYCRFQDCAEYDYAAQPF